eukprot:c8655_g3_i1.p1 GENE.c8655_g3_i1~~c8655_g3_i1.p1  ORF type:complete len:272 (+),score=51.71 c8655_g3_i1:1-816(+)
MGEVCCAMSHILPSSKDGHLLEPPFQNTDADVAVFWMTQQLGALDAHNTTLPYEETIEDATKFAMKHMDLRLLQMGELMHAVDASRVAEFAKQCSTAATNAREVREMYLDFDSRNLPNHLASKFCPDSGVVMEHANELSGKRPYPRRQKESLSGNGRCMPLSETTLAIHANSSEALRTSVGEQGRQLLDFIAEAKRRGANARNSLNYTSVEPTSPTPNTSPQRTRPRKISKLTPPPPQSPQPQQHFHRHSPSPVQQPLEKWFTSKTDSYVL